MSPKLSILLPSLRQDLVLRRIREFATIDKDLDYEIIVVSPFKVDEDKVKWIYEEKQFGVINAQNIAYGNSTGEYIIWWADDCSPTLNCLSKMLNFVERGKPPFIGAYKLNNVVYAAYGKMYANLGCVSRATLDIIGGYFDPIYKGYWCDIDMSLRVWDKNGKVEVCPDIWVDNQNQSDGISQENKDKFFNDDMYTFLKRWHDKFGHEIDLSAVEKDWRIINHALI